MNRTPPPGAAADKPRTPLETGEVDAVVRDVPSALRAKLLGAP